MAAEVRGQQQYGVYYEMARQQKEIDDLKGVEVNTQERLDAQKQTLHEVVAKTDENAAKALKVEIRDVDNTNQTRSFVASQVHTKLRDYLDKVGTVDRLSDASAGLILTGVGVIGLIVTAPWLNSSLKKADVLGEKWARKMAKLELFDILPGRSPEEKERLIQEKMLEYPEREVEFCVTHFPGKTVTLESGAKYQGVWLKGVPHGKGKCTYSDGGTYNGDWEKGLRHGTGKWTCRNGDIYEGEWKNDEFHGPGKETVASDGSTYKGEYQNGHRHGKGFFRINGNLYSLKYEDGALNSCVTFVYPCLTGRIVDWKPTIYTGPIDDWKPHGRGNATYHPSRSRYEGEWQNGKRHGRGIFTKSDGSVYDAEWLNDKIHGQGSERHQNGSSYEGAYQNGKRHGHGVFTNPNGVIYEGAFVNGECHGEGVLRYPNGDRYKVAYAKDKLTSKVLS